MVVAQNIDEHGDGTITQAKIMRTEMTEDYALRQVEQTLNFLINSGVVGALLFSVLFPVALTPLVPSDESVTFFGDRAIFGMLMTYFFFIYSSLFFSIWITFVTIHYYLHISIWMPTLELKLWYLTTLNILPSIVSITFGCILASSFSLPFGIAVTVTPMAGLISLGMDLIMLAALAYKIFSPAGGDAVIVKEMHTRLQTMFVKKKMLILTKHEPPQQSYC